MEITRNQYYMAGLVLLLLGIQFRMVETVELTPELTRFLDKQTGDKLAAVSAIAPPLEQTVAKKTVPLPDWLGYSLLSIGSVLVLHSWAMKKPGT